MANRYHNLDHQNSLNGPPKKPGLVAREQQLAAVESEAAQFRQELGDVRPGLPMTGNVSLKQQRTRAQRNLKRQQQYAAGQYPSGQ